MLNTALFPQVDDLPAFERQRDILFVCAPHACGVTLIPASVLGKCLLINETEIIGPVTLTYEAAARFLGEILTEEN